MTFNLMHGFYRAALSELRTALELVTIGTYGNLFPQDADYSDWKNGVGDFTLPRCRRRLASNLRNDQGRWMFEDGELVASVYQMLSNYAHSRPDASHSALWKSNGPIYSRDAVEATFDAALVVYALSYLMVRVARPSFDLPKHGKMIFTLPSIPNQTSLVRGFVDLFRRSPT